MRSARKTLGDSLHVTFFSSTVDVKESPVEGQIIAEFESEGRRMWSVVFVHGGQKKAGVHAAGAAAHGAAQRDELRGEVVGLLQEDLHCSSVG